MAWALIVSTLIASLAYVTPKLLSIYAQMSIVEKQLVAFKESGLASSDVSWRDVDQQAPMTGGGYV